MSAEQNVEICPYWRKWISYDNSILALCGAKSLNEQISNTREGMCLQDCPHIGPNALDIAFNEPTILEIDLTGSKIVPINYFLQAEFSGKMGVEQLEHIWNQEVEKFIQRHSQTS